MLEIIIATTIVSLAAFAGLITAYKHFDSKTVQLKWIISLAAGSLLAVSFLDLIPEAIEGLDTQTVMRTVLVTFIIFFLLERVMHWHHCHCQENDTKHAKHQTAIANLFGDALHNLIDGFLIASAFLVDRELGVITTIAVLMHEIPQEISDYGILIYAGYSKKKALTLNFLFATTVIIGGVVFYYFGQMFEWAIPYMAAISAGTFIYLSASDLIPELDDEKSRKQIVLQTIWLLVGVGIIYALGVVFPHNEELHQDEATHQEQGCVIDLDANY